MTTGKTIGLQLPELWECGLDSHTGLHWQAASKTVTLHGCFYISIKIKSLWRLQEGLLNAVSSDLEPSLQQLRSGTFPAAMTLEVSLQGCVRFSRGATRWQDSHCDTHTFSSVVFLQGDNPP